MKPAAGTPGFVTRREWGSARTDSAPLSVADIMRSDFMHVGADADLWHAQQIMLAAGQEALPVLDGERLHGMLTSADIRAAFVAPPAPANGLTPQLISPAQPNL